MPEEKRDPQTFVDVLSQLAEKRAEERAFTWLKGGDQESEVFTYASLHERARAIAHLLSETCDPGDRILLLYPPGLEFTAAWFGCIYAGMVAVPAYPPKSNNKLGRLLAIFQDAQSNCALTDSKTAQRIQGRHQNELPAHLRLLITEDVELERANFWLRPKIEKKDLAFLQYTSGSTGNPKGVMVSQENLLLTCQDLNLGWNHNEDSVMVTWLPTFHDMGLIYGVLTPLYVGFTCVQMAPISFLQRPVRWLQAFTRYKGTHSAAPNFAFELCVARTNEEMRGELDLSSIETILNAAEPIRQETFERFRNAFAPCGFRASSFSSGYGLAEATLKISTTEANTEPTFFAARADSLEQHIVEAGDPNKEAVRLIANTGTSDIGTHLKIVDPNTHEILPELRVGEIWASGLVIAQGYWQRPEETRKVFEARAKGDSRSYLRTGDFGFLHQGQLYISGRLKDLIIIGGRNHYPHDLEKTVEESHPLLRPGCGAAFSVLHDEQERVVIMQEVSERTLTPEMGQEIVAAAQTALVENHDISLYALILIKARSISKTSSGKIMRRACHDQFLRKEFKALFQWQQEMTSEESSGQSKSTEDIRTWLRQYFGQRQSLPVDDSLPFSNYGLDSMGAANLLSALETWLEAPGSLSPTLFYDYPNISSLANYLTEEAPETSEETANDKTSSAMAVIGIACRFPGADNVDMFGEMLREGGNGVGSQSPSRKRLQGNAAQMGGYLDDIDSFDAAFFGISASEATAMDPQQRLAMQVAWEALEDAAINPHDVNPDTGVYLGMSNGDYRSFLVNTESEIGPYLGSGIAFSMAANRISYFFNLQGPSMIIDTACSSSLVAVNKGCEALNQGHCSQVLVGGVNLILNPAITNSFEKAGMMASDGYCKTFDESADGYVRGEGCAILVLKRLEDAQADGDPIRAVICASSVNQDGRSNGLTAPNGSAQRKVIASCLQAAKLKGADIDYVELHGTGTALGDPIEVNALVETLGSERSNQRKCQLGSVKTQIGHLEAAAGIAGLIKVILSLESEVIPANLHFKKLNPLIQLDSAYSVASTPVPWPRRKKPRYGAVSSFGFGGTNAHLIVREAPQPAQLPRQERKQVLCFSANHSAALAQLAMAYADQLAHDTSKAFNDICRTANCGRAHLPSRLCVLGNNPSDMEQRLRTFLSEGKAPGLVLTQEDSIKKPYLAFLFTGQLEAYPQMGTDLAKAFPIFRQAKEQCKSLFNNNPTLKGEGDCLKDNLEDLFTMEYALATLWESWGITPKVVMGYGIGEVAAACFTGVLSLHDGVQLVQAYARVVNRNQKAHTSLAFELKAEHFSALQANSDLPFHVAAYQSPEKFVISGHQKIIDTVASRVKAMGGHVTTDSTNMSFSLPENDYSDFFRIVDKLHIRRPRIPMVSCFSGKRSDDSIASPAYWRRHPFETIHFDQGMNTLMEEGCNAFLEIGLEPALLTLGFRNTPSQKTLWLPSLRKGRSEVGQVLKSLGCFYVNGQTVDWPEFHRDNGRRINGLPQYPFEKTRYWPKPAKVEEQGVMKLLLEGNINGLDQLLNTNKGLNAREEASFADIIKCLSEEVRRERGLCDDHWLYHLDWKAVASQDIALNKPEHVMIFADYEGHGELLAEGLEKHGATCQLVYPGVLPPSIRHRNVSTPWAKSADFENLIDLFNSFQPTRYVYMWNLTRTQPEFASLTDRMRSLSLGCTGLLSLIQVLQRIQNNAPLHVITKGAIALAAPVVQPEQGMLWGIGKVAALEHGEFWGSLIDVEQGTEPELVSEILCTDDEDQVALRAGKRLVPRLKRQNSVPIEGLSLSSKASYLITGGLGSLGLRMASFLVDQGARHLMLCSRRTPDSLTQLALQELCDKGAEVHISHTDVSDSQAVRKLFGEMAETLPPLAGIIHAAGVVNMTSICSMTHEAFEQVINAKVNGAWNLHQNSLAMKLDFFLLMSSISSVWGGQQQAHYAAANHYLDTLAAMRRHQNLVALSVNWGPFSGGGMANDQALADLERIGIGSLEGQVALAQAWLFVGTEASQITVANMDWDRFTAVFRARGNRPLLDELTTKDSGPQKVAQGHLAKELQQLPPGQRMEAMIKQLQSDVAALLGHQHLPDSCRGFFDLGLDSLTAVALKKDLEQALDVALPSTLILELPDIQALARHILTEILQLELTKEITEEKAPIAEVSTIDSDLDALALINQADLMLMESQYDN